MIRELYANCLSFGVIEWQIAKPRQPRVELTTRNRRRGTIVPNYWTINFIVTDARLVINFYEILILLSSFAIVFLLSVSGLI